jgi:multidrug resistance efflux pump
VIGSTGGAWSMKTIPLARHPRGFPKLIAAALLFGLFVVALLWFGFSVNYAATRDVYFAVAIAHVLAEAPFLLRMI